MKMLQRKHYRNKTSMCKDKEGNFIGEEGKVLERWAEYYITLLNTGVEEIIEEEDEVHPDEEEPELDSIGKEETEEAIDLMNNKDPGEDGIQAEFIKYGGEALKEEIYKLVKNSLGKGGNATRMEHCNYMPYTQEK
jgi:hypothetical protein